MRLLLEVSSSLCLRGLETLVVLTLILILFSFLKRDDREPGMVADVYNTGTWETEAGGVQV